MLFGGFGFILFLISKGSGKSYCERNINHVLCNSGTSETDGDNESCQKNVKRILLSKEDEMSILSSVNLYREKVAKGKIPKGSGYTLASPSANMMRAKWDPELAIMANKISNLCKPYQHCEGCLDLVRFPSVFVQSYSVVNDENFEPYEWKSYIEEIILTRGNSTIGHSTPRSIDLLIWAEVYLVGCGLSIFPHEGKTIHNFVCAFGPVVPDDNEEPSVLGLPCSYCPLGSRCLSDLDVLCDCESSCYPLKYEYLVRVRRQDDNQIESGENNIAEGTDAESGKEESGKSAESSASGEEGSGPQSEESGVSNEESGGSAEGKESDDGGEIPEGRAAGSKKKPAEDKKKPDEPKKKPDEPKKNETVSNKPNSTSKANESKTLSTKAASEKKTSGGNITSTNGTKAPVIDSEADFDDEESEDNEYTEKTDDTTTTTTTEKVEESPQNEDNVPPESGSKSKEYPEENKEDANQNKDQVFVDEKKGEKGKSGNAHIKAMTFIYQVFYAFCFSKMLK